MSFLSQYRRFSPRSVALALGFALLGALTVFLLESKPAHAQSAITLALAASDVMTKQVDSGSMQSSLAFDVDCTGGVAIADGTEGFSSLYCQNKTAVSVKFGGSVANAAASNVCISTAAACLTKNDISAEFANNALFCTGAATINCLVGR